MSDSPNVEGEELHPYHPDKVLVDPDALSVIRSVSGKTNVPIYRAIGLAMEFSTDHEDEFEDFVRNTEES